MTDTQFDPQAVVNAVAAGMITFLQHLAYLPANAPAPAASFEPGAPFDPETDTPPIAPDHKAAGPASSWGYLILLGTIWKTNFWQDRPVRSDEIRPIAQRAGYSNGNVMGGFRRGSMVQFTEPTTSDPGGYTITPSGQQWVTDLATKLGVTLPSELVPAT